MESCLLPYETNSKNKNSSINNNMKDNRKNNGDGTQKENSSRYRIKSNKRLPQVKDLIAFEEDMVDSVHQIRFRKVKSNFQRKLNKDLKTIKSSNKTLMPADETSNMYKLTKDEYNHLLDNAVTATYKKATKGIEDIINKEGIKYAKRADIFDRIEINGTSNCFTTLKDHKENFVNHPTTRLINPAKNEIGRINKAILDKTNICLCEKLKPNEWKNTTAVINWFEKIDEKHLHTFTIFDIKDFYPSIRETLLKNAIQFAAEHTDINKNNFEVIFHARKSLLFHSNQPWIKRDSDIFDVTMEAYDGAEICELVGIFMLSLLSKNYSSNNIGLYRDDGLSVFRNISGQQAEKQKIIQKFFKDKGLQIIIKCNLKIFDYLGVTLNLNDGTYHPFHKPNEETTYIHVESDHPPQIIKKILRSVEKRLSSLSSTKGIFENLKDYYEQRLRQCGYNKKLNHTEENNEINQKSRKHNIFWFNPPYSKPVKTNIGKLFLRLINKHFSANA